MKKLNITFATILLALGCFALAPALQADPPPRPTPTPRTVGPPIVGVWQVTRMGVNCQDPNQHGPPFPFLMTFNSDGTLSGFGNAPGGGPLDTPEAGVWQHEAGDYSFRDVSYSYDQNGAFAGSGVVTATVHLTDANSFTYTAIIQFFDVDGNLVFTGCGRATGERFQ